MSDRMESQTAYKILRPNLTTHNACQWVVGEWKQTSGTGGLCGPGWLHGYRDPLLAVLHNPIHANYAPAVLYRVEVSGQARHEGWVKSGWTQMRLIESVPWPVVRPESRIRYAIRCAWAVCHDPAWRAWARGWLTGHARSAAEAAEVAWAVAAAAEAAAAAAEAAEGNLPLHEYARWAMREAVEVEP